MDGLLVAVDAPPNVLYKLVILTDSSVSANYPVFQAVHMEPVGLGWVMLPPVAVCVAMFVLTQGASSSMCGTARHKIG